VRKPRQLPAQPVDKVPDFELADIVALKAVEGGIATPDQQTRAMSWILRKAAAVGDMSYRPDPSATAFHEGRRFVGLQIVTLLKLDHNKLKDD
jgi:hypothetical protein